MLPRKQAAVSVMVPMFLLAGCACAFSQCPAGPALFDAQGNLQANVYVALAASYTSPAGVAYRYGCDYSSYHGNAGSFPTYWEPEHKHFDNFGNGPGWNYELGAVNTGENDYSGNQAQVMYLADASSNPGVATLQTLLMGDGTFSESPQLTWAYYGGGDPEPNLLSSAWTQANGGPFQQPVALAHAYGNSWNSAEDLMVFADGFIGAAGTNTSDASQFLQLPPNKIPTAIALTDNDEFALVTVWDTQALKGQLAVLALGTGNDFWGDWTEIYPGLRNNGLFGFIKLLGFLDLPGMVAPTGISVSTDYSSALDDNQGWLVSPDGTNGRYVADKLTLSDETNRQSFITGSNKNHYAKAGFAAVISKSEGKVAFVDLKPLFQYFDSMYFTTSANFQLTRDVGQAPSQWPYTFDAASMVNAPALIETLPLSYAPTAVRTSIIPGVNQAYVATEDGTLHVYTVGGYGDGSAATPNVIAEVGTVAVGLNPTCIAYAKHDPSTPGAYPDELIVVARGDRTISWVQPMQTGGTILRTLQDSRLLDPVWAEDNDNHGALSYLLTVADHEGKQVSTYRYGPVVYATNGGAVFGMGPDGQAPFEFGGAYALSGKPFQLSGSNVP